MQHGVNPSCDALNTWEDTGIQGEHLKLEETSSSVVTFRTQSHQKSERVIGKLLRMEKETYRTPVFGTGGGYV